MPRFYLHTYNGSGTALDDEGLELSGLAAAREQAIDGIRSILSEEVRKGKLDLRGRIEISDGKRVLETLSYSQALEFYLEQDDP